MGLERYFKDTSSDDLFLEIGKRNIPGHFPLRKFYNAPNVSISKDYDAWDYALAQDGNGGTNISRYVYTAYDGDGEDYYVVSDNAADEQFLLINILDQNYYPRIVLVKLNGLTPVLVNDPANTHPFGQPINYDYKCKRVFRMSNQDGTNVAGSVYCIEGNGITAGEPDDVDDVRAYINNGNNQTLMSHFTIPAKTYGLFMFSKSSVTKSTAGAIAGNFWRRDISPGGVQSVFRIQDDFGLNSVGKGGVEYNFYPPGDLIPPKSDIVVRAQSLTNNLGVSGNYIMILIDEKYCNRIDTDKLFPVYDF